MFSYVSYCGVYSWASSGVSYGFYCGGYIISLNDSFKYLSSGVFNYKLSKWSPKTKYKESVS